MNPNRQKVLDATIQLLSQSGLSGAGLNDVIALSGASRGSLYHYFPDGKQQWVTEALRIYAAAFSESFDAAIAKAPTVALGVASVFRHAARMMSARDYQGGCPVGAVVLDLDADSASLRAVCLDIMAQWRRQLADHLDALPADEALSLANLVIASFEGAFMLARLERSSGPLTLAGEQVGRLLESRLAQEPGAR